MRASVVIGSNFGDEGKGNVTNWLSNDQTTVIRFNGGAQAGHTVEIPRNGFRTVFSHLGAGSHKDAATWLTDDFVINPIIFRKEMEEFNNKVAWRPPVYFDYRCKFTTPWDILLNQEIENLRADDRHGSVGLGFGETIERYEQLGLEMPIDKILNCKEDFARFMIDKWVPARAKDLGIESRVDFIKNEFSKQGLIDRYFEDVEYFLKYSTGVRVENPTQSISFIHGARAKKLVFEGAQGLLLDQYAGTFPHVTRSNTGLMNINKSAKLNHVTSLDVYYVTRCYMTRHGAGPLSHEMSEAPVSKFEDKTNRPNAFQGSLRFAPLDLNKLRKRIDNDLRYSNLPKNLNLVVTCLDQIGDDDDTVPVIVDGVIKDLKSYELMGELMYFFPEFNLMTCSDAAGETMRNWFE